MSPGRIRPGSAAAGGSNDEGRPLEDPMEPLAEAELHLDEVGEEEAPLEPQPGAVHDVEDTGEVQRKEGSADAEPIGAIEEPAGASVVRAVAQAPLTVSDEPLATASPASETAHHGWFRRLYFGETHFDFVRRKRIWFAISLIVIAAGSISLGIRGLNLGIEFVGGTSWTVGTTTLSVQATQNALNSANVSGATVVALGTGSSRSIQVQAKLPKGESAAQQTANTNKVAQILQHLAKKGSIEDISTESVGPSWGGQITHKALIALIVFFVLIALYISIFFEWRMAFAAIIAVLHDILVTVGIYSLSGFLVTPDTVVAFLTILGYSLYDTIVVFDRIRDNMKTLTIRDRLTFSDLVNLSMNQTIARSINTSLVAIMPILAVLVLGAQVFGASTLQYFGLALLVGLATGAYSSIFVASPLVALMKEREPRYVQMRERLEQRGPARLLLSAADIARGFSAEEAAPRARGAMRTATAPRGGRVRPGSATAAQSISADASTNGSTTGSTSRQPAKKATSQRRPAARSRRRGGRR